MEKDTLQQKLEIAEHGFPTGVKVCNVKIGTVGIVSGRPFINESKTRIFVPVTYYDGLVEEDIETLFVVRTVKKGVKRNS